VVDLRFWFAVDRQDHPPATAGGTDRFCFGQHEFRYRAQAVRQVAENQNLSKNEFNRAFVLMHFGYLRRDPNDQAHDVDYSGYDFWLQKLNFFNGNYNAAQMVQAFIESIEYRQRFGQV